tara:strand:- start:941 stop:1129 length:189 start_codon:yes stop_codon:yes gene_type:complete
MIHKIKELINGIKISLFLKLGHSLGYDQLELVTDDDEKLVSVKFTNRELNLKRYYNPDEQPI